MDVVGLMNVGKNIEDHIQILEQDPMQKQAVAAAGKQVAELSSKYRSDLQNERIDAEGQYRKFQQDMVKQEHKTGLLELKAPQAGIATDLATHTVGTVVSPGTITAFNYDFGVVLGRQPGI